MLKQPGVLDETLRHRLLDLLLSSPPAYKITYEQFLAWADEDTLAEWVDGEIIMTSPASLRHQEISLFLASLLRSYIETLQLGKVLSAPFQMRLSHSGREPDLIFIRQDHLDRLKATYLDGPADLVVEIISPESAGRDRGAKFFEYEEAGTPEYWLIDPVREQAEFYQLDDQGRYSLVLQGRTGTYHSRELSGFWLAAEWLWQDPLPPAEEIALAIGGETYARYLIERLKAQGHLP
ncbi:MAG: Uma2 family endonuclease [Chloroflexi bacterium]|nr:Uma2 family endonuclease [Chloroflexota bacterium]